MAAEKGEDTCLDAYWATDIQLLWEEVEFVSNHVSFPIYILLLLTTFLQLCYLFLQKYTYEDQNLYEERNK